MSTTTLKMTSEDARKYLKEQICDYIKNVWGIDPTKGNFNCIAGTHEDSNPSMSIDKRNLQAHCFSCGAKLDIFDLVQLAENVDFKEAFELLCDDYNIEITGMGKAHTPVKITKGATNPLTTIGEKVHTVRTTQTSEGGKDYSELYKKWRANLKDCTYLTNRGISMEVQKKYNVGYEANFYGHYDPEISGNAIWKALIIPTSKSTFVARNTDTTADKHHRYKKVGGSHLFNFRKSLFKDKTPIFITEGEIDALSFLEVGAKAIGLGSTANVSQFAKKVLNSEYLNSINVNDRPAFIVCLDIDKAGLKATSEFMKLFEGSEYTVINACEGDIDNGNPIYGKYNDANEILQENRGLFVENIRLYTELVTVKQAEKLEQYKKERSAFGSLTEFWNGIKNGASTEFIPTGFNELDKTLDGGITEGLYIIGAISSLGKTTYTLQMADQIAKAGTDVLIFSLEMAKTELMAKSLSRITYMFGDVELAKTARGITTSAKYEKYSSDEVKTIENAVREYSEYAQNVYIIEGMGDVTIATIKDAVKEHIELTKRKPVVIIDYIQLIAPESDRMTDKQIIDKSVLGLKRLSRDYKIPVVAISSFNRQSYRAEVSMASFKESGALEYGSDVLIGLQLQGAGSDNFDEMEQKSISNDVRTPRRIELKILKNRNGRTGDTLRYRFYSAFNFFTEETNCYKPLETTTGKVEELAQSYNAYEFDTSDLDEDFGC